METANINLIVIRRMRDRERRKRRIYNTHSNKNKKLFMNGLTICKNQLKFKNISFIFSQEIQPCGTKASSHDLGIQMTLYSL